MPPGLGGIPGEKIKTTNVMCLLGLSGLTKSIYQA